MVELKSWSRKNILKNDELPFAFQKFYQFPMEILFIMQQINL